jgi:hypothetical protein
MVLKSQLKNSGPKTFSWHNLLSLRRDPVSAALSSLTFASFSVFLYFALIDMVLTVPLPVTMTASSGLSIFSLCMLLLASVFFGMFGWKLASVPTLLGWVAFYLEYLTPEKLNFWSSYLVSSDVTSTGADPALPYAPFWLRADVYAILFFLVGFAFLVLWQIHSNRTSIFRVIPRIFLVPAVMLLLFELVIGTINPDNLESNTIIGLQTNLIPAIFYNLQNIWMIDIASVMIALCLVAIFFQTQIPGRKSG